MRATMISLGSSVGLKCSGLLNNTLSSKCPSLLLVSGYNNASLHTFVRSAERASEESQCWGNANDR